MILLRDYFGKWENHPDLTDARKSNAIVLLDKVNLLLDESARFDIDLIENPATGTYISGQKYGGFRPQDCPQGAPTSSHKEGHGVDIYDPHNALDNWITDARLEQFGLYREYPLVTRGWCHLTDRAPRSGKRTFLP
jgi:hypothetical protein